MNKLEAFKFATRTIVGVGTTIISKSIIDNNVAGGNLLQRVCVASASVVIGSMASEASRSHTDTQIDALAASWNQARSHAIQDPINA